MSPTEQEPLPCRVCGGRTYVHDWDEDEPIYAFVECGDVHCESGWTEAPTRAAAIRAWNERNTQDGGWVETVPDDPGWWWVAEPRHELKILQLAYGQFLLHGVFVRIEQFSHGTKYKRVAKP